MSINLKELKKVEKKIFRVDLIKLNEKALTYAIERIVHCTILILEDFEKKISSNKDSIDLINENIRKFHNRINKLEQVKTFFPMTEDKHRALFNNCVDNDEAILRKREIDCPKDFTEKVMDKINKKRGKNV